MKFIHTADWQIGKGYARIEDEDKRAAARKQRIEAIRRIGDLAREHAVAFVVVAGDLFDSPSVSKGTVSAALGAIGSIDVPVIAIPGNHDHGGPGGLWQQEFFLRQRDELAGNLVVLQEAEPLDAEGVAFFPCPLLRRSEPNDTTAWLRDPAVLESYGDSPRIVIAHGSTTDFSGDADAEDESAPITYIDLARLPEDAVDYIALGDWHGTKQVGSKAWYSGTPEPDRFPKGGDYDPGNALLVDVERGRPPVVARLRTSAFAWHNVSFLFDGEDAVARLETRLGELCGMRTDSDFVHLDLRGSLGIAGRQALEQLLDTYRSRLLRLKLSDSVSLAPTEQEILALTRRADDPITSLVAQRLVEMTQSPADAELARAALLELHAALR